MSVVNPDTNYSGVELRPMMEELAQDQRAPCYATESGTLITF